MKYTKIIINPKAKQISFDKKKKAIIVPPNLETVTLMILGQPDIVRSVSEIKKLGWFVK